MARMGKYDSALQMFVQSPGELNMKRLTFLRWLAEQGRLEHRIAGPSSGPLAPVAELKRDMGGSDSGDGFDPTIASFRQREGVLSSVMGGRSADGVQLGSHAEGSQSIRFRR